MNRIRKLVILILITSIFSCATTQKASKVKENSGFVFGQLIYNDDLIDEINRIEIVNLNTHEEFQGRITETRFFFRENLPPGTYYIKRAGYERNASIFYTNHVYYQFVTGKDLRESNNSIPESKKDFFFIINGNGDFHYLGEISLKETDSVWSMTTEVSVTIKKDKDMKKALQFIIPYTEGTGWDKMIRDFIHGL